MAAKESTFNQFLVCFGAEDFELDRDISRIAQSRRRIIRLDGDGMSDATLVGHCEAYSDDPRTIILDNAQDVKGDKELARFIERREPMDRTLVLAGIIRGSKLPEVWIEAGRKGKVVERKKPKPWETEHYASFVETEATRNKVRIAKDTAAHLVDCCGPDLWRLANETKKLALYVGQAGTIKNEHIALVTTRTPHILPYQVADSVLRKEARKAMSMFSVLALTSGVDKACINTAYALMGQVEDALVVKSLQSRGMGIEDVAVHMGVKPGKLKYSLIPIVEKHTLQELIGYMGKLCKLDADVKSATPSKRTMVELVLLSIAQ